MSDSDTSPAVVRTSPTSPVAPGPSMPSMPTTTTAASAPAKGRPGLFKRLTTKLKPPAASAQLRTTPLTNGFAGKEHREAALRERGLLPPKDLSQQEAERDARVAPPVVVAVNPTTAAAAAASSTSATAAAEEKSEAERIREEWQRRNINKNAESSSPTTMAPVDEEVVPDDSPVLPRPTELTLAPPKAALSAVDIPLPPSPIVDNDDDEGAQTLLMHASLQAAVPHSPFSVASFHTAPMAPTPNSFTFPSSSPSTPGASSTPTAATPTTSSTPTLRRPPPPIIISSSSPGPSFPRTSPPVLATSPTSPLLNAPTSPQLTARSRSDTSTTVPSLSSAENGSSSSYSSSEGGGSGPPRTPTTPTTQPMMTMMIGSSGMCDLAPVPEDDASSPVPATYAPVAAPGGGTAGRPRPRKVMTLGTPRAPSTNLFGNLKRQLTGAKRKPTLSMPSSPPPPPSPRSPTAATGLASTPSLAYSARSDDAPVRTSMATSAGSSTLRPRSRTFAAPQGYQYQYGQRAPMQTRYQDRGSIVVQANMIEDEESRRLSELAFLD